MNQPIAIVLAAGQGKRMKTDKPKVLVEVLGRPMIHFVLDAVFASGISRAIVVVGYKGELVQRELAGRPEEIAFAHPAQQNGTGHAVMMCKGDFLGSPGRLPSYFLISYQLTSYRNNRVA